MIERPAFDIAAAVGAFDGIAPCPNNNNVDDVKIRITIGNDDTADEMNGALIMSDLAARANRQ